MARTPKPTSPGDMLTAEWLTPLGLTQSELARKMGVDVQVVNGIVRGRRAITARTALHLARVLGTTPEFWMNLQSACDLYRATMRV
jgi:antitoxin HigA-1